MESGELGFRKLPVEDIPKKRAFRLQENFGMLDLNGLVEFCSDTHQCGNSENSQLESHSRGRSLESAGWCTHQSSCSCSPNCLCKENSKCYFKYQWLDTGLC